jgi:hypothetical protein
MAPTRPRLETIDDLAFSIRQSAAGDHLIDTVFEHVAIQHVTVVLEIDAP